MPAPLRQHGYVQALRAARYLRGRSTQFPGVAVVLGSGLGALASRLTGSVTIPYASIPYFPRPAVKGHTGRLLVGRWKELPVAVLAGRVHLYEGYSPAEIVFAARVLGLAGVGTLVLTCAAGGIAPAAAVGSLMVISDHLNFLGSSPLAGPHDKRWGERFVDMSRAYDPRLRRAALKSAQALRLKSFEGVYAALTGPQYETPGEIRALKRLGADAVGMSTVPEVIAARQLNMRVLAIALITNRAAGLARRPLHHDEVLAAGSQGRDSLAHLLEGVLPSLAG
jgi:purine-nucleoside phosphorylase